MKTSVIRARCTPEIAEQVDKIAAAWRLKPSDIVRLAVEHYIAINTSRPNPLIANTGVDPFEAALRLNEAAAAAAANSPKDDPTALLAADLALKKVTNASGKSGKPNPSK